MMNPIYTPKGRAGEYAELAINIYTGCNHGCTYCYARKLQERYTPKGCVCTFDTPQLRPGVVEEVRSQLARGKIKNRLITLCFTCDPYPAEIDTTPTREVIQAIKESENNVQVLTKGGFRAERDFDLLDKEDWFGVTISGGGYLSRNTEPKAAMIGERLYTLEEAKKRKINTWVSCEPVIDERTIYGLITSELSGYIDLFKIGKLNHAPSSIDWASFGRECERLCQKHGRNYYIKADLRAEMELDQVKQDTPKEKREGE